MLREREVTMESGRTVLLYAAFSPNRNPSGKSRGGGNRRRAAEGCQDRQGDAPYCWIGSRGLRKPIAIQAASSLSMNLTA